jgi:hypothetical protein
MVLAVFRAAFRSFWFAMACGPAKTALLKKALRHRSSIIES